MHIFWRLFCTACLREYSCFCSLVTSVIPDPDFYPSRIPDLKRQQKRGVKKNSCHTFSWSHKSHRIENYFIFEMLKEKIWANFQRVRELFTSKIVTKLSKVWIWDTEKTYSGSRIKGSKRHRIRIRNTACNILIISLYI
jgi:hypothetical protein